MLRLSELAASGQIPQELETLTAPIANRGQSALPVYPLKMNLRIAKALSPPNTKLLRANIHR